MLLYLVLHIQQWLPYYINSQTVCNCLWKISKHGNNSQLSQFSFVRSRLHAILTLYHLKNAWNNEMGGTTSNHVSVLQMNGQNSGTKETMWLPPTLHPRELYVSTVWHWQRVAGRQCSAEWSCFPRILIPGEVCQDTVGSLQLALSSTGNPRDIEAKVCSSVMSPSPHVSHLHFSQWLPVSGGLCLALG